MASAGVVRSELARWQLGFERLRDAWHGPRGLFVRQTTRVLARGVRSLAAFLLWQLRSIWGRLGGRAQVAVALAALVLLGVYLEPVAPSFAATAEGLAVLVIAARGLWMIGSASLGRRR